ncbi:MAG: VacJ family lipoprotein [Acidiferrobacteraceae bacterium]|jgi:phospholipid-binding lipoprotein MlaA|nr:VacJ family lipoprotein [Acidiferrobacteraceae bacterium]MBT3770003.1 VacJ family lipoprotein [Acidiferrobacteraceae bacterium]MBT4808261.1 VacJ family lipoprotein [Acidiferrobacteraceae bacterium]MBT5344127.1 VacJ family lipoprotein [Acidiferrobacteraceae bacterium]MBT6733022.1 VacJ family lipoprotein [Acidiferrobacteraceae bacterium]
MVILMLSLAHSARAAPPSDPLEPFNRAMHTFNDVFDRALVKPLATGYRYVIPSSVRRGVGNFFNNLREPTTFINDLLQGKPARARQALDRFLLNSSIGIFGLIDIATPLGKPPHEEDYGQTLAVWGVPSGPYLVLPFLGPSTVRDSIAKIPEFYIADPLWDPGNLTVTVTRFGLRLIDLRSRLLGVDRILQMQVDPYLFLRETYLQQRSAQIGDGATLGAERSGELEKLLLEE